MAPHAFDERRMGDAQSEQEAARVGLVERPFGGGHRHGVAPPDVGDPGGDDEPCRAGQQQPGVGEGLAAHGLRDPEGRVAERFDLRGRFLRPGGGL